MQEFYKLITEVCKKQKQEYQTYLEQQSPRLNLLDQWRASYENSHSRILAKLLNPKGEHKQGDLFLKRFLHDVLGIKEEYLLSNVKIIREKGNSEYGRLDLAIYIKNIAFILIENKLDAGDQPNQLARYYEGYFDESFVNQTCVPECQVYLCYLTLNGKYPSEDSTILREEVRDDSKKLTELNRKGLLHDDRHLITPSNKIKCISYEKHIIKWLENSLEKLKTSPVVEDKNNLVESALIQYIDTLRGLTNTRKGMNKMKENMVKMILGEFDNVDDISNSVIQTKQLRDALSIAIRTLCSIEVLEEWTQDSSYELFLGIKENHRQIYSIGELKEKLLIEKILKTFFIKFPINKNSWLSVEFIPQLHKDNFASIGILKADNKDNIKLEGKRIKDHTGGKNSIWDYVERYKAPHTFVEIKERVNQILKKYN